MDFASSNWHLLWENILCHLQVKVWLDGIECLALICYFPFTSKYAELKECLHFSILYKPLITSVVQVIRDNTGREYFCSYQALPHLDLAVGSLNAGNGRYNNKDTGRLNYITCGWVYFLGLISWRCLNTNEVGLRMKFFLWRWLWTQFIVIQRKAIIWTR